MILGPDGKPTELPEGVVHLGSHWLPVNGDATVTLWDRALESEVDKGKWIEKEMRVAALRSTVPGASESVGDPIPINVRYATREDRR